MSTKKCEMCGLLIENAKNRQRYCPACSKKRQAQQFHEYYLKNREYYLERSLAQSERRKQQQIEKIRQEELLWARHIEPKYSIKQVVIKAEELCISYGKCSFLLSIGKITI